ncbi:MAG: zinc-ribbon domain-containing protein [Methanoregula sp.]
MDKTTAIIGLLIACFFVLVCASGAISSFINWQKENAPCPTTGLESITCQVSKNYSYQTSTAQSGMVWWGILLVISLFAGSYFFHAVEGSKKTVRQDNLENSINNSIQTESVQPPSRNSESSINRKFCSDCGAENLENKKICSNCGSNLQIN